MLATILEGVLLGGVLSILTGPIFFTILQVSIERGMKAGVFLVSGQWMSDYIYMAMAFWGASYMQLLQHDEVFKNQLKLYLGTSGSVFLAILGLVLIIVPASQKATENLSKRSIWEFLIQGFLINSLTPFPILFWLSLMGSAVGRGMNTINCLVLGISIMFIIMLTDMIKIYAAQYIRQFLTSKMVKGVRKIAGIALFISGIILFVKIFFF